MKGKSSGYSKVEERPTAYGKADKLETPEVGAWAEKKYQLVHMYDELFASGMKNKWTRVYLDLYSGAGKALVRKGGKVLLGSPLLALNIPDKYDKYVFCEENRTLLEALRTRVSTDYPDADVSYVHGDCNRNLEEIISHIPKHSPARKVLTFCFVDPFSLNIEFKTIKRLSELFVDFLILLAFSDASRNQTTYISPDNDRIERFLGEIDWREKWLNEMKRGQTFVRFLEREYISQMASLGYPSDSAKLMIEIRSDDKNLSLYHLAFFSRSEVGYRFWRDVQKYALAQTQLSFGL